MAVVLQGRPRGGRRPQGAEGLGFRVRAVPAECAHTRCESAAGSNDLGIQPDFIEHAISV